MNGINNNTMTSLSLYVLWTLAKISGNQDLVDLFAGLFFCHSIGQVPEEDWEDVLDKVNNKGIVEIRTIHIAPNTWARGVKSGRFVFGSTPEAMVMASGMNAVESRRKRLFKRGRLRDGGALNALMAARAVRSANDAADLGLNAALLYDCAVDHSFEASLSSLLLSWSSKANIASKMLADEFGVLPYSSDLLGMQAQMGRAADYSAAHKVYPEFFLGDMDAWWADLDYETYLLDHCSSKRRRVAMSAALGALLELRTQMGLVP